MGPLVLPALYFNIALVPGDDFFGNGQAQADPLGAGLGGVKGAENQLQVSETVRLSSDPEILQNIVLHSGPSRYLFLLGYAGWGPGQLEYELTDNGWLTLPAEDDIIFNTPDQMKWKVAAQKFGIDITTYGDVVGSA